MPLQFAQSLHRHKMALAEVVVAAADEMEVHLDNPPHHPADKVVRHPLALSLLNKIQGEQENVEVPQLILGVLLPHHKMAA